MKEGVVRLLNTPYFKIGSSAVLLQFPPPTAAPTSLLTFSCSAVLLPPPYPRQAGGCYVPLDPTFPADRLSIYLEDSQAVALIMQHSNATLAESLIADLPCRPQVRTGFISTSAP